MVGCTSSPRVHDRNWSTSSLTIFSADAELRVPRLEPARDLVLEVVDVEDEDVVEPVHRGSTLRGTAMSTKKSVRPLRAFMRA